MRRGTEFRLGGRSARLRMAAAGALGALLLAAPPGSFARTQKPALHGAHWMAVTGKPLAATAGAMIFERGGNAVDAACAMIAATSTMWDTLSWGGETQALIRYNPRTGKVIGINGARRGADRRDAGVLPQALGMRFPPEYGPPGRGDARHPRRPHDHARRVRHDEPKAGAGACDPDGGRVPDGASRARTDTIEKHVERMRQWPDTRRVIR